MGLHPALGIAVLGHAEGNAGEAGKGQIVDDGHDVRQIDVPEIAAILEGVAADGGQSLGKGDGFQTGAALERRAAQHLQPAVFGKVHRLQVRAAAECVGGQLGDACTHVDGGDEGAVGVPGNVGLAIVRGHGAGALQGKDAVAGQAPGQVLPAYAGGHHGRLTLRVGDAAGRSPILGIAAVSHAQHQGGVPGEGIGHNGVDAVRQIELPQRRAVREGIVTDIGHGLRQPKRPEAGAAGKGVLVDPGDPAALGEGDLRQVPAGIGEPAVQIRDAAVHIQPPDIVAVAVPWAVPNPGQGIVFAGAHELEQTVSIEDEVHIRTGTAGCPHVGGGAAGKEAALKQAGLAADIVRTVVGIALIVGKVEAILIVHMAGQRHTGHQIHQTAALLLPDKAGELLVHRVLRVAADVAEKLLGVQVKQVGVLIVLADRHRAAGELVQNGLGAVGGHVISGNGGLEAVGGNVHIDAVEVQGGHVKVEVGIVHDGVRLAAGGAADVVHRAVFVHLTAGHGGGAGIAVVIAGEIEVDPRRVAGCGQILHVSLTAAGGVGVVSGHMGHQHLPGAGALGRVLHQPLGELLDGILIGGVVQHGDVHVAPLHGVPGGGNAEHAPGSDGAVAAVVGLVVADDVDHIRIADAVQGEQGQGILPLVVVADVIHCVAQLDAEVILPAQAAGDAAHALQSGLLLDIRQQEEPGLLLGGGHREAAHVGPDGAVAHLVIVGGPGLKARQGHAVDAVDLLAGGVGDQAAGTLHLHSAGHVGVGRKPGHSPITAVRGVAHPGDGLAVSGRSQVVDDVIGSAGFVAHGVIAEQGDLIGAVARFIGSPQVHAALAGRQAGDVDPTVLVGIAQQHVVGVHMDTGGSLAVPDNGDGGGGGAAHHGSVRLDAVHGLNGPVRHGGGEAGGVLVQVADVQVLRLLAAVRSLGDLHVDAAALGNGGGDVHGDNSQGTGGVYRMVDGRDAHGHNALGSVIVIRTGNALREGDAGDGIAAGNGDIGAEGGDGRRVGGGQRQLPGLAHSGLTPQVQRHTGHVRLLRGHGEIPGLAGDVAVAVLQVEGDGVQTAAEVHQAGGAAQVVPVIPSPVGAVEVEVGRLHAGGVGIRLLAVVVGNEEAKIAGAEGRAVFQLGLGAVVVDQLDGVHHGSGDILVVGAVHHAQVIQQDIALQVALVQLRAVGGIPADAAGGDHGPEQHAAVDPDQRTGILGQISLQILPAGLQALASSRAAVAEIYIGVGPALAAVGAGGDLGTEPGDRNALGNVDPHAQSGGRAADGQVVTQANARTVRTGQACPIVFQLDSLVSETDDISVCLVGIGYYRALHHAAAARVVISGHGVGCHTGKALHSGADGRVVPGVLIAAVQDHFRFKANVDLKLRSQVAIGGSQLQDNGRRPFRSSRKVQSIERADGQLCRPLHGPVRLHHTRQYGNIYCEGYRVALTCKYAGDLSTFILAPGNVGKDLIDRLRGLAVCGVELRFQGPGRYRAFLDRRTDDISKYLLCYSCALNTGTAYGHAAIDGAVGKGPVISAVVGGQDIPLDIRVLKMHRFALILCHKAQVTGLSIVQSYFITGKGQLVRVLDVQHGGAHGPPAADQVHRHVAGLAGGNKGGGGAAAVYGGGGHRAHGLIADGEAHVLRQSLGGSAGEVHGVRRQGDGGAGGIVLIAGGNGSVVKLAGGRHGGHHQDGAGHHALAAAGRGVAHGDVLLTLPLGDVGGGAALVQLDGRHAAQGHHHLGLLGCGIAHGAGSHGAVGLEQHHGAVGLDAHAGAGIVAAVAGFGDHHLAVPDHGHQCVHGLQDLHSLALLGALIRLGLGQGGALPEHVHRAVVKGGDKRTAGIVVVHNTVHHQIAGGLAGVDVEPGGVDAAHYVQPCLFFIDMGLVRGGFQGPALFLGVAVAVAGHDLGAAACGVHLHDVGNRL